jgi:malate/lactate dehydrogenase
MIDRLGIVGCGNVGAALVMEAAAQNLAQEVVVAARNQGNAEAAILDAGSSSPKTAVNFTPVQQLQGSFDIVAVTAGEMPHQNISQAELLERNFQIAVNALGAVKAQKIIVIGTPVDRLTERLAQLPKLKDTAIIGFGGQLDTNRAVYALLKHSAGFNESVYAIGEHGPRTIPVYNGEDNYDTVRADTTSVLKRIGTAGKVRNLATGKELARLICALGGKEQVLCVSAPDKDYDGLSLTWPYLINQNGLAEKVQIPVTGPKASALLKDLTETRKKEASA